jgi:HB1, ASXL, restriction endonuclease HTH domain
VLQVSRRPMTAKGILEAAYKARIVPSYLYGKTQEKTLQARLSEDILYNQRSLFFRTQPGYFFLAELISDPTIPDKFKERFPARRRTRDLHREPSLAIDAAFVKNCGSKLLNDWTAFLRNAEACNAVHYRQFRDEMSGSLVVWTFSMVRRHSEVLSYRLGRYRDDRDTFLNKRTIGFPGVVSFFDRTLFSDGDYGAKENSLAVILSDLDISAATIHGLEIDSPKHKFTLPIEQDSKRSVLLLVMDWTCPEWFEPTTRRLSLNDPQWIDLRIMPNNLEDFEPWTLAILNALEKFNNDDHSSREDGFPQV